MRSILTKCSNLETAKPHIQKFQERLRKAEWPEHKINHLTRVGERRYLGTCDEDGVHHPRSRATREKQFEINRKKKEEYRIRNDKIENVVWSMPFFVNKELNIAAKAALKQCKLNDVVTVKEQKGKKLHHMCGVVDFRPFECSQKRQKNKECLVCKTPEHPKYKKPKCDQSRLVYIIQCNICKEEYVGETERSISERFGEHMKKLSKVELNKYKNPKKNDQDQLIIQEHQPSAVSAHAMLMHNGTYDFSLGMLSVQLQEDGRKAYEALICKEIEPKLNRRMEGGGVIPI